MIGWIKLHRSLTEHWIYNERRKFSKLEAWIDILMTVNYEDNKVLIKGKLYEVKRGQSILSLDSWAKRWNWDKSAVRRLFNLLQNDSMIEIISDNITTHITVCKYDSYQGIENANETQTKRKRNSNEIQTTPIKEDKNINKLISNMSKEEFDTFDKKMLLSFYKLFERDTQTYRDANFNKWFEDYLFLKNKINNDLNKLTAIYVELGMQKSQKINCDNFEIKTYGALSGIIKKNQKGNGDYVFEKLLIKAKDNYTKNENYKKIYNEQLNIIEKWNLENTQ